MKLRPSRSIIASLMFAAVSLVSLTYFVGSCLNYSSYWNARSELTSTIDRLTASTSSNGTVTITAIVSATNPTEYSGMIVRYFELRLSLVKPGQNQTLFSGNSNGDLIDIVTTYNPPVGDPLGPTYTLTRTLAIQLSPSQSTAYMRFAQPDPAQVYGQANVIAIVDSFLDRAVGPEIVQSSKTIQLS